MKKQTALATLMLLLASSLAFAKQSPKIIDREEEGILRNSSEHMRQEKEFLVDGILFGVGPNLVSTQGVEIGKYIDADSVFLFQYTKGTNGWGDGDFGSRYEIKASSFGVHYKKFSGNSFYWRGGVDYRLSEVSYKYTSTFSPTSNVTREFKGNSFALNFQIGNQWQWENFTLGCDWIGYTLPVASNITSETLNSNDLNYDQRRLKEDEDVMVKNGHINLLRFYLGFSF